MIERVGGRVVDADFVDVNLDAEGEAYVFDRFFDDGEGFEPEEVHLDETGLFDDTPFILRAVEHLSRFLVVGDGDRHPVADGVAADDEAAGMNARVSHVSFEHFGIANRVVNQRVGRGFGFAKFGNGSDGIGQVQLGHFAVLAFGEFVGNEFAEFHRVVTRKFLHTCHISEGEFRRHGAVGDDVSHVVFAIFLRDPVQDAAAAVVVEIDVNIRERDTVRIQETLKQEVIFNRVYLRDAKTVCHGTSRCRATSRSNADVKFFAGGADVVLHDEEVAREAHGLHDVELKVDSLLGLLVQRVSIAFLRPFVGEFAQIVRFEFDAVEFVVAAEFFDFRLPLFSRHDDVAVLVSGEFVEEVFFGESLAIFLLRSEVLRNGEVRHDGCVVDAVGRDLVKHLTRGGKRFGQVGEDGVHFRLRLHPLLLGVEHSVWVVQVAAGAETDETVVRLGVFFIDEVNVVGAYIFYTIFISNAQQLLVDLDLHGIGLAVGADGGISDLVALEFDVVVIPEDTFEPAHRLLCALRVALHDFLRNLAAETGGADDEVFVEEFKVFVVGAGTHVESIDIGTRNEFDEVVIAVLVLCQDDEVPSALVNAFLLQGFVSAACHIHLTAEDGFEVSLGLLFRNFCATVFECFLQSFPFGQGFRSGLPSIHLRLCRFDGTARLSSDFFGVVEKLFDAHHVAMIGDCQTAHSVGNGFVHQARDRRLPVEDGILCVYVKMNEILHNGGEVSKKRKV